MCACEQHYGNNYHLLERIWRINFDFSERNATDYLSLPLMDFSPKPIRRPIPVGSFSPLNYVSGFRASLPVVPRGLSCRQLNIPLSLIQYPELYLMFSS